MTSVEIRRGPLERVAALDIREPGRDFAVDEAAIRDRFSAAWAGLDDRAWRLPGASTSDGGGPDWSFFDHVAHVSAWCRDAAAVVERVLAGEAWPTLAEQEVVDYDRLNEEARPILARMTPAELRAAFAAWRERLLALVLTFPRETMLNEDAWEYTYFALFGHLVDHLAPIEPWADELRRRIEASDPLGDDPRLGSGDAAADAAAFLHDEAESFAAFDEAIGRIPAGRWREVQIDAWTLHDHVGHVAAWFEEAASVLEEHARSGGWPGEWASGIDGWNAHRIAEWSALPGAEVAARLALGRQRLRARAQSLSRAELRSEEGWGWTYQCMQGHLRQHLAAVAPVCVRAGWPARPADLETGKTGEAE